MYGMDKVSTAQQMIPNGLQELVRRELEPGEMIRWIGQPIPRFFSPISIGTALFGIPWLAFAIFWTCGAAGFKVPDFSRGGFALFPLFGVPFILIGIGLVLSPVWAYRRSLKTVYVITGFRAITFDVGWTTTIRSYRPAQLQNVFRKEKKDGSGDVVLGQSVWTDSDRDRRSMDVGFMNIREAKRVERLIQELVATVK